MSQLHLLAWETSVRLNCIISRQMRRKVPLDS